MPTKIKTVPSVSPRVDFLNASHILDLFWLAFYDLWRAQEVAESKQKHDARQLFQMGKKIAGKQPKILITDGLHSYHLAYMKEFWTRTKPRTEHIRHITIRGDKNNNKMERLNGEIRDREKTMRGLKTKDTPILTGYQIFHNYIRPHEALEGKTPSEACGITIEGKKQMANTHPECEI